MNTKKLLAALLALVCVIGSMAACRKTEQDTADESTTATTSVTGENKTVIEEETTALLLEGEETTTAQKDENKIPSTKEEILAAYTEIMNRAKKDAPAYKKAMYQELPDDEESRVISDGKTLVGAGLKVASNYMIDEKTAKKKCANLEKGNDMTSWPVVDNAEGCLLKDASALKDASYEVLPNGNVRITIVLNPEENPEPTPAGSSRPVSNHGSVFCPLSKVIIDDQINGSIVSAVFSEVTYSLTYHDCSSTIVYNPETMQVVSLDQTCHVTIKGSGKTMGMVLGVEKQELINYLEIYDIVY